jgi:Condensation domain
LLLAGLLIDDAYIIVTGYDLPYGTDSMKLRQAFEEFVNHSNGMMLRTLFSFEPMSGRWLQVLVRPGAKQMEWTTVIVANEAELDLRVNEYQHGHAIQPFKNGELLTRVCIFELDGYARVLVWSLHHALTDHWAIHSYVSDIGDTYASRPLPSRRPFKSMIKYLERLDRTVGLDFWRGHLQNVTPTPFLLGHPGSRRVISDKTATREVLVDHRSLTKQFGILASTLVTAAWSIVLAAHSNCTDVTFGQALAGRSTHHFYRIDRSSD